MDEFMIDPKENILNLHDIPTKHIVKQIDDSSADTFRKSYFFIYLFFGGIALFFIISKFDASKTEQYLEDIKNKIKETLLEYRDWKDRIVYNQYIENGAFKATKYNTDYLSSIYSFIIGFL